MFLKIFILISFPLTKALFAISATFIQLKKEKLPSKVNDTFALLELMKDSFVTNVQEILLAELSNESIKSD